MSLTFTQKIFALAPHEIQRTRYAWLIRFIFKTGVTLGWTTVLSLFVSRFSISALPVLFLIQALLTISGVFLYSIFIDRYEARFLVYVNGILAAATLLAATIFLDNAYVFFPLVLIANGIFIAQILIFLSNYIEDFFTPRECQRTFPIIESAETIGGIVGGFLLSNVLFSLGTQQLLGLWILLIIGFLSVIFLLQPKTIQFYNFLYEMKVLPDKKRVGLSGIKKNIRELKHLPFLQILMLIFFLQWMMVHFLEFQYTRIVHESVGGGNNVEHGESLAHGLGNLHMIFYGSALLMQLLLASRLIRHLGTFGGFLFHTTMSFLGSLSMLFGFGYFTTVLAKNNAEMSGIINKNAYEASYYAFRHGTQRALREFFDGFIAPVGMVFGTISVYFIQNFFVNEHSSIVLNVVMVLVSAFVFYMSFYLQTHYTSLVKENLFLSQSKISRLYALEILEQKGHRNASHILIEAVKKEQDTDVLKKMLRVLIALNEHDAIPVLISFLDHRDDEVKITAVDALFSSGLLRNSHGNQMFSREKVLKKLEEIYRQSGNLTLKIKSIRTLIQLTAEPARLLREVLLHGIPDAKILALEYIAKLQDSAAYEYVLVCLEDNSPRVKAKALAVLYKQQSHRHGVYETLEYFLHSHMEEDIEAACEFLYDIQRPEVSRFLHRVASTENKLLRFAAYFALFQRGDAVAPSHLADLLFEGNPLILEKAKMLRGHLSAALKRSLGNRLQELVMERSEIIEAHRFSLLRLLEVLQRPLLEKLKNAYDALGLKENVELIQTILIHKNLTQNQNPVSVNVIP